MWKTGCLFSGLVIASVCNSPAVRAEAPFQIAWVRQFGTPQSDEATGVSVGSAGAIYVTGSTNGALDGSLVGDQDWFLRKYETPGSLSWGKQVGQPLASFSPKVSADTFGSVFVSTAGGFRSVVPIVRNWNYGSTTLYDAAGVPAWTMNTGWYSTYLHDVQSDGRGNAYITGGTRDWLEGQPVGGIDGFLQKCDRSGNILWTRLVSTSGYEIDEFTSVAVMPMDHGHDAVYTLGLTTGSIPEAMNSGGIDILLSKFDESGNLLWQREFGTSADDYGGGIDVDSLGNVYVVGSTQGSLAGPSNGASDIFLRKYDSAGSLLWSRQWGTPADDYSSGIAIDDHGITVVGSTGGSFPGATNAGGNDVLVTELKQDGTFTWVKQFGTSSNDAAQGVALSASGDIYVSGNTLGTFPGASGSGNNWDAWLARLAPPVPGDYNNNGVVDAADYIVWRNSRGQMGSALAADGNGDGIVDTADYDVWRAHFGQTVGSGASAAWASVPELATGRLLTLGILMLTMARRKWSPVRTLS